MMSIYKLCYFLNRLIILITIHQIRIKLKLFHFSPASEHVGEADRMDVLRHQQA